MKRSVVFLLVLSVLFTCAMGAQARVLVRDKSVVKIGEDVNMGEGLAFKDLVAIKGNVNVKGDVGGDIVAVLGSVHLFRTAKVAGDVVSVGGSVIRDDGSVVKGQVTEITIGKGASNMASSYAPYIAVIAAGGFVLFKVFILLGFIGIATITISFFTKQIGIISSQIERQWLNSFLWGILGILLIAPVAFLLMVTIIGIPLILVELLFISIGMTMGYIAVSQLIGKRFLMAIRKPNQPMLVEAIWGLFILFLVDLVPFLGPLVKCIVVTMGFGGAIITKLGF